jgi:uncharacterized protein
MIKPRGALCNLSCQYCYFLKKENLYPGGSFRMSEETLELYTRQYIQAQPAPEVNFYWQGGEPTLMGLEFFQLAVKLQKKYSVPGKKIQNFFQTNATQLDADWCQFFKDNEFLVGVSLDGPRELHDAYRRDKGGRPTFDRVMAGLDLLKQHGVEFNILATVNRANAGSPLEVYRFLRDKVGAQFLQFIPIVDRENATGNQEGFQVRKHSVTGKQYGEFLIAVFDEWVRRDVGKTYVQIFDVALQAWVGQRPGLCIFEPTCGQGLAVEHTGDVYACDHFVEPGFLLGNIHETSLENLVVDPRQIAFGQEKLRTLPKYCLECKVRFLCNGGCPKDRIRKTPGGEEGLNFLCAGYQAFFTNIDRPMQMMASLLRAGRAPAEVMKKLAA